MQSWYKGKSDVAPSLKYKEPKCLRNGLPDDVVQMGMQTVSDLKHVEDILKGMNRKAVEVCTY